MPHFNMSPIPVLLQCVLCTPLSSHPCTTGGKPVSPALPSAQSSVGTKCLTQILSNCAVDEYLTNWQLEPNPLHGLSAPLPICLWCWGVGGSSTNSCWDTPWREAPRSSRPSPSWFCLIVKKKKIPREAKIYPAHRVLVK